MIQILGLRKFKNEQGVDKAYDAFFDEGWRAPSVDHVFRNAQEIVDKIPENERYNIYYTMAVCTDEKRKFLRQEVMGFDIDGIDVDKKELYIDPLSAALGLDLRKHANICFSGNGLQIMLELLNPILSDKFFNDKRIHYKGVCEKIDKKLMGSGLPGKADPSVFSTARIMRMPLTENRKPNKPVRQSTVMNLAQAKVEFHLELASGLPNILASDEISAKAYRKYPLADTPAVLQGCQFLKSCAEKPEKINEPLWYAMLSITTRLKDGNKISHDMSQGHPSYSQSETESKITHSQNFGPRTCENINSLWGGCKECPYFGKVTSPILIRGADYIKTESTGFHDVSIDKETGIVKIGKPNYEDLRKFFNQKYDYQIMGESEICYVWNGKCYEVMADIYLENFAQSNFDPVANTTMTQEFKNLVCRTNITKPDWFHTTTEGLINFSNGVFNIKTMELLPHDKSRGFRYVLPYEYDPKAKCPKFDKFLDEVTGGDKDCQDILMEFAGYAFSNDKCWAEKALVCTGEGANGKSTLLNIFRELAGRANYCSLTLQELKSETNRQLFDGRLFNIAEETPNYALMESSGFKNIITGGEVMVRMLYKQPYSIRNKCKLIFACNELPRTKDTTDGFFRRMLIVPFNQKFEGDRRDPHIFEKLTGELSGIFNLVFKGYQRLAANKKFTNAEASTKELKNYRDDIDNASRWIKANVAILDKDSDSFVVMKEMYTAYSTDTKNEGEEPVNAIFFGKKLAKNLDNYEQRATVKKIGRKAVRVISGVSMSGSLEM